MNNPTPTFEEMMTEFDEMEKNHGWIPEHRERVLAFLKDKLHAYAEARVREEREKARLRRERELYLVAESCAAEGWDFARYLNTWAALMQNSTPPPEAPQQEKLKL